ncbi:hypothetical protein F8M41_005596 [Gigaspora margarita]|uniref:Uncharacterized protein n=1 Tax=Gigaspora margarita TaxID=4874 RepID=A0A8H4AX48_GIGMA|nr:hypothetical protein F8M41_005596 [Gigaspora margarita]
MDSFYWGLSEEGRKKKEVVTSSSDNLNNLLNNTTISQSESTGVKKGHKKKVQKIIAPSSLNDSNNNMQSKNKRGHDVPDNNNNNNSNDNSVSNYDDIFDDNDINYDDESAAQDFTITSLRPESAHEIESNNQNMPMLSSNNNHQIQNNISSKRILSSRLTSTSASRESSPICYRPMLDQESRNEFDFSKRMNPIVVPDSRANGQFDHISLNDTLKSRPMSPLESRNNTMNILMNDIFVEGSKLMSSILPGSTMIQNQENNKSKDCRDFLEEIKCLFLHVQNPIKVHLKSWSTTGSLQREEIVIFVNESATTQVLERWLNATNIEELKTQNSMHYLCKFIQHAFAINYLSRDTERMKTLDNLTKKIAVPSQNGKNLASNLHL